MFITCAMSQNVPHKGASGVQMCTLRPGRHNYPMLSPADPLACDTLRVLRKLGRVQFDELLPGDENGVKVAAENPVGRHVNEKSKERIAKEAKAAKEKGKNATVGGNPANAPSGGGAPAGVGDGGESGGIPGKKKNTGI